MKQTLNLIAGAAVMGLAAGAMMFVMERLPWGLRGHAATPKLNVQNAPIDREARFATGFAPVVKRVAPSVVNIYSSKVVKDTPQRFFFFDNPFGSPFGEPDEDAMPRSNRPRTRKEQSLGSGVVVSEDGFIVTNNHVVEGADEIKVALSDNRTEYVAKVVGTDPQTDLAVLKVDAKGLAAVTFADSDKLLVGDLVLAVGNPFGVGQTVTMGIASAVGRGGFGVVDYEDYIQTDASINPGNSGGALVDAEGRLVGINTWIMSRSGGNQGIGFAIPANLARLVLERISKDGRVARGYMGVVIQPVTADLAEEFKLPRGQEGALVGDVSVDGPAASAGFKEGDVIIEFNGKPVADNRHLRLSVSLTPPKTRVTAKVLRDGKEKLLTVTLGELPDAKAERGLRKSGPEAPSDDPFDGVEVGELDARWRRQLGAPATLKGAVVTNIDPNSPAAQAGLRRGDVITEIDRRPVRDADDAVQQSDKIRGRVLLRVWTAEGSRFLVVDGGRRR
jgi:serine protease Do